MNDPNSKSISSPLKIVGLSGSLRPQSFTRMAVNTALSGAAELGAEVEFLDLRLVRVACDGGNKDNYPEAVHELRAKVKAAQGIILGTPEYHGSFSGILKNALDLMGFEEFSGKMMGLVSVSAGAMGGLQALASLRSVGRSLHAWVVPQEAAIPFSHGAFNPDETLKDDKLQTRVLDVGRQVARFAYLHTSQESRQFMEAWEQAVPNPGGKRRS